VGWDKDKAEVAAKAAAEKAGETSRNALTVGKINPLSPWENEKCGPLFMTQH